MSKVKTWSHVDLVTRAERWLRNTLGCSVVVTETVGATKEIPDALGWKFKSGRSLLVECKTSLSDFRADKNKLCRLDAINALGAERYYFAPEGIIPHEEVPENWGLVEVKGVGAKIVILARPRKDLRTEQGKANEFKLLVRLLSRITDRVAPVTLDTWLKYDNRTKSLNELYNWVPSEDHKINNLISSGWTKVVKVLDLPVDPVTEEPWCPLCSTPFSECDCHGLGEQNLEYCEAAGETWAKKKELNG